MHPLRLPPFTCRPAITAGKVNFKCWHAECEWKTWAVRLDRRKASQQTTLFRVLCHIVWHVWLLIICHLRCSMCHSASDVILRVKCPSSGGGRVHCLDAALHSCFQPVWVVQLELLPGSGCVDRTLISATGTSWAKGALTTAYIHDLLILLHSYKILVGFLSRTLSILTCGFARMDLMYNKSKALIFPFFLHV